MARVRWFALLATSVSLGITFVACNAIVGNTDIQYVAVDAASELRADPPIDMPPVGEPTGKPDSSAGSREPPLAEPDSRDAGL